jgi:hypothetical protein
MYPDLNELESLLNEINSYKYSKISKVSKEDKNSDKQINEISNQNNPQNQQTNPYDNQSITMDQGHNQQNNDDITPPTGYQMGIFDTDYPTNKYEVLTLMDIIGIHNEPHKLTTAEFVKELKNTFGYLISVGNDKKIKVYNKKQMLENSDLKEWIYDIIQINMKEKKINPNSNNYYDVISYLLACTNKEICSLKLTEKELIVENRWELPNMACSSMLNMEFTETVKIQNKNNKNKKNKSKKEVTYNYNYLVVAGRSGVMCLVDIFGDKTKEYEHFDIIKGGAYRGLCKISKTRFAVTSNSIINDGMNKLIIYNFDNDENKNTENNKKRGKIEFPKDENDATDNISFIASNFGMATLSENILLCACKKYTSKDKNGIFMVIIPNEKNANFTKMFFETGEFEVHCICPINKKSQNSFIIN